MGAGSPWLVEPDPADSALPSCLVLDWAITVTMEAGHPTNTRWLIQQYYFSQWFWDMSQSWIHLIPFKNLSWTDMKLTPTLTWIGVPEGLTHHFLWCLSLMHLFFPFTKWLFLNASLSHSNDRWCMMYLTTNCLITVWFSGKGCSIANPSLCFIGNNCWVGGFDLYFSS